MRVTRNLAAGTDGAEPVVLRLASQIVTLLGTRPDVTHATLRPDLASLLEQACLDEAPIAMTSALACFRRFRIGPVALADIYIPDVARRLGQGWLDDRLGFAEVSNGSARLQTLLRELNGRWVADDAETPDAGEILLVVPFGEQHTLGAMVAMGQLRRLGVSVCLRFGPTIAELVALMHARRFDGVFISLSSPQKLDSCRELIVHLKSLGDGVPIILGGAVLTLCDNALELSGADDTTEDIRTALSRCGIVIDQQPALQSA